MATSQLSYHAVLMEQTSGVSRNNDQGEPIGDSSERSKVSSSSSAPNSPSRRSRRRRKKPGKMEGPSAESTGGRVLLTRESVWGSETQMLEEALSRRTSSLYSGDDVASRRYAVDHLEKLLAKWGPPPKQEAASLAGQQAVDSLPPSNPWQRTRPTLITFGSYRLGVHRADSDLDVLALCPPEYTRSDFFQSWVNLLKSDSYISKVHPIPQAYTPVIKFMFREKIQVDMLFARLADSKKLREFQQRRVAPNLVSHRVSKENSGFTPRIEYVIDDSDLKEQDEAGVRSLNGARVSQMLLEMVPDLNKFRTVLRAVKEWAVCKGIYSNVLGFLGGVNYAILVARICKENPHADAPSLLKFFFQTYWNWNWRDPVRLRPIQSKPPEGAPLMPAWDPQRNPRDSLHIMPIITPAYPSMNSSYNVGIPQRRRISEEMYYAYQILSSAPVPPPSIRKNLSNGRTTNVFSKLFEPSEFFSNHEFFLKVTIQAADEHDFMEWFRLVESKLRLLIISIETPDIHAWPYSRFFDCKYDGTGTAVGELGRSDKDCLHESLFFIALRFPPELDTVNLIPLISDFLYKVNSWPGRKKGMDLTVSHLMASELPLFVRPVTQDKENNNQGVLNDNSNIVSTENQRMKSKNHYKKERSHRTLTRAPLAGPPSVNLEDDGNIPCSSASVLSCERAAETEETQSMASDASFGDTNSSCSSSAESHSTNHSSPMKRICVVGNGPEPENIADEDLGGEGVDPSDSTQTTTS